MRVNSRWSWLLLLWFPLMVLGAGQKPQEVTLTPLEPPGEPFPDDRITCFLRDQFGILWMGTQRGLVRYHFSGFRWYHPDPEDPTSLISGDIKALHEDVEGNFWVATIGGLHRMDRSQGRFERIPLTTAQGESLDDRKIQVVWVDRQKRMWLGTDLGLFRLENGVGRQVGGSAGLTDAWIAMVSEDEQGRLWVASFQKGIYLLPVGDSGWQRVAESWPQKLNAVLRTSDGTWWLGCHDGLYLHQGDPIPGTPDREPVLIAAENVTAMAWDGASLWVGATQGAQRIWLDESSQRVRFPDSKNEPGIFQIYADPMGMVWVSLSDGGVYFWNQFQDHMTSRPLDNAEVWTLNGSEAAGLWVGTKRKGLWQLAPDLSVTNKYLEEGTIRDMAWDPQERMWIGTDTGLFSFSPGHAAPVRYEPVLSRVWSILPMGETLWIGKDDGVWQVDPESDGPPVRESWVAASSGVSGGTITALVADQRGGIWVGSYVNGLIYLDPTTQTHREFNRLSDPPIPSNQVIGIYLDTANNVWISSAAGGLSYLDASGKITTFGQSSDLSRNAIVGLCQDNLGRFWANASSGIVCFTGEGAILGVFGDRDGVVHGSATPGSILAMDENLWFGGVSGITHIQTHQLPQPPETKALITSYRADGEELRQWVLPDEEIRVPEDKGTLALSLAQMDPFTYKWGSWHYRRDGMDEEWIPMEGQELQVGRYLPLGGESQVQIKTLDHRQKPLVFKVQVTFEPPWWRAWLPIWGLAAILGIVFATYLLVSHFERQRRKKLIEEARLATSRQKLAEEKAAIAERERLLEVKARQQHQIHMDVVQKHLEQVSAEMANDLHDGPLSELRGLGFQLSVLKSGLGDTQGAQQLSVLQETLLPSITVNLRKVCGELMLPSFDQGLLPEMEAYLQNLKMKNPNLAVETQWQFEEVRIDSETKRILFRIFRTLVKNVEDHAEADRLMISLRSTAQQVVLTIQDNGKGFGTQESYEVLRENKHYGLYMAQFFAEGLQGDFRIQGQPGKGTIATVEIPVQDQPRQERTNP